MGRGELPPVNCHKGKALIAEKNNESDELDSLVYKRLKLWFIMENCQNIKKSGHMTDEYYHRPNLRVRCFLHEWQDADKQVLITRWIHPSSFFDVLEAFLHAMNHLNV